MEGTLLNGVEIPDPASGSGRRGNSSGRPRLARLRAPLARLSAIRPWLLLLPLMPALLLPSAAPAAPERLGLDRAVSLARENNPAGLRSRAQSKAAAAAAREARRSRWPLIEAREVALRTDSPADVFGLQLMQERFSFPAFTTRDPNDPAPLNNFATELEASLPLFTGGRLSGGISQASAMAHAADAVRGHTQAAVDLGVVEGYLGAQLADSALTLARRARDTTRGHVKQAQDFYDSGMIVESDLLQAKVQLARMEEGVITAEGNAVLARAGLNRALGLDQSTSWILDPPPPEPPLPFADSTAALEEARRNRMDLRAAAEGVRAAQAGIAVARGALLPELGVSAKASWNDDTLFGGSGNSTTLMAAARWRVWDWGKSYAGLSRARQERTAAEETRKETAAAVEFDVRQAWQGVQDARARLVVAGAAVGSAEKALNILEDRFTHGVSKVTDLLDAETMLHEARLRELTARFDLQRAIRTLYFATGRPPVPEVHS